VILLPQGRGFSSSIRGNICKLLDVVNFFYKPLVKEADMKIKNLNWLIAITLILLALASAVVIPRVIFEALPSGPKESASVVLTILIIAGVLGFLGVLAVVSLAFAAVNQSDRNQALGLPQGTVRAVIALSLIFMFLIAGLYLYSDLRRNGLGKVYTSTGISEEMAEVWLAEGDDIVSVNIQEEAGATVYDVEWKVKDKVELREDLSQEQFEDLLSEEGAIVSITPREEAGKKVYDVQREVGQSEASEDFASQILTTVSTLVVAIAGFYFGTRAVAAARGEAVSALPVITGIDPDTGEREKVIEKVKISGENFDGPVEVKLVKGISKVLVTDPPCSSKEIVCTFDLTGKPTGKWDLIVVNQDGGECQRAEAFIVTTVPTVDSINPSTGKIPKKISVTIAGTGFVDGAKAELRAGEVKIPGTELKVKSDKEIKCTFDLKDKTADEWDVVVINPGEKESKESVKFTVTAAVPVDAVPTVDSINPSTGKIPEKVSVTIAGTGFVDGAKAELRAGEVKIPGTELKVESDKEIKCTFDLKDKTADKWDVVVINPGEKEGKKARAFTVTE
jgi:hypothetical protein